MTVLFCFRHHYFCKYCYCHWCHSSINFQSRIWMVSPTVCRKSITATTHTHTEENRINSSNNKHEHSRNSEIATVKLDTRTITWNVINPRNGMPHSNEIVSVCLFVIRLTNVSSTTMTTTTTTTTMARWRYGDGDGDNDIVTETN